MIHNNVLTASRMTAALNWAKNPTEENRIACDDARCNARIVNTASCAAADAAYAAAAADAADRKTERKWQADKIREIIPCPF